MQELGELMMFIKDNINVITAEPDMNEDVMKGFLRCCMLIRAFCDAKIEEYVRRSEVQDGIEDTEPEAKA